MSLAVDPFVLNDQFAANCYLVRASEGAREAAVVDPGGDPAPLLAALERLQATAAGILVTHSDVDHIEGVAALATATGAEVWAPAAGAGALRTGHTRGGYRVSPHDPEHEVEGGDTATVAGIEFEVVGIPGHSVDHVAFCAVGAIFSGDLLFAGSVGRTDFEGGDWETLLASIRRLFQLYGPFATVYPGHGAPTTLGHELASNPFLADLRP